MKSVSKMIVAMGLVACVGCGVEGPQGPEGAAGAQGPAGTSPVTDVQTIRFFGNIPMEGTSDLRIPLNFGAPEHRVAVKERSWVLLDASMGFRKSAGTIGVTCELELLKEDGVTKVNLDTLPASLFLTNDEPADTVSMETDGTLSLHGSADLEPGNYLPVARCTLRPGTTDKMGMSESWLRVWTSSR